MSRLSPLRTDDNRDKCPKCPECPALSVCGVPSVSSQIARPAEVALDKEKLTTARRTTKLVLATTGSRSLRFGQTRTHPFRGGSAPGNAGRAKHSGGRPKVYAQSRTRCAPKRECRDTPCPAQLMSVEVTFQRLKDTPAGVRQGGSERGAAVKPRAGRSRSVDAPTAASDEAARRLSL